MNYYIRRNCYVNAGFWDGSDLEPIHSLIGDKDRMTVRPDNDLVIVIDGQLLHVNENEYIVKEGAYWRTMTEMMFRKYYKPM